MRIDIAEQQLRIDGRPRIVLAAEVHYFRLTRADWPDRIRAARDAGATAIASYIPWLVHEQPDRSIDVSGRIRPENDVGAFIDLCREHDLLFLARPGPFVMAELKNEGLPYRLYTDHPEIVPTGWSGRPAPTRTVDYLAPAFLAEVRRWYAAICPVLAARRPDRGGNVIGLQLDNEIGMLAWVSNSPDLTEHLLADFRRWVGPVSYPVEAAAVRDPAEPWAGALRRDLSRFMRDRFARYVDALRDYATECGVTGVPFLINIHGTEGGAAESFPIGISQLLQTYARRPGLISGSDHYVGELTLATTTDLYVLNVFSDAVHDHDQPLTSLEFEAGTGDYGGEHAHYDPSTVDLKTRLFVAQGNRLINYYLFAGGTNPPLAEPVGDGNDRISFTGERHGVAAPVGPEGQRGPAYAATAAVMAAVRAHEQWLAAMRPEYDELVLGFVPDSYLTEYHHPDSPAMRAIVTDLRQHRGGGARRALAGGLLQAGYRFGALDLQGPPDPERARPVLALATGVHLDPAVQARVAEHVRAGGGLLLLGRVPVRDLSGAPCTVLADALGVRPGRVLTQDSGYFPSVSAPDRPETRVGWLQEISATDAEPLLRDVATGRPVGLAVRVGAGRAVLYCAELPGDPVLFERAAGWLGASPGLRHDDGPPGLFVTSSAGPAGRLVHLLNISGYPMRTGLRQHGAALFDGRAVDLPPRTGRMLAAGLDTAAGHVAWSTAELSTVDSDRIELEALTGGEAVLLRTDRVVRPADDGPAVVRCRREAAGLLVELLRPGRHRLQLG